MDVTGYHITRKMLIKPCQKIDAYRWVQPKKIWHADIKPAMPFVRACAIPSSVSLCFLHSLFVSFTLSLSSTQEL
jgi:hypothetical protein